MGVLFHNQIREESFASNGDPSKQLADQRAFCDVSPGARMSPEVDIVIHAEEVGGIVFLLNGG